MYESMYARLENIATEDNDREDRLGTSCPIKLDLWLVGGHQLRDVALVDGLNSLDDETIDLKLRTAPPTAEGTYTVAIAHIAMLRHTWPCEADEQAAVQAKAGAA